MKAGQYFSLIAGIIFAVIGVLGFVPSLVTEPTSLPSYIADIGASAGFGYLLGLFPINVAHNVLHLVIGGLGIAATLSLDSARLYAGLLAFLYGTLTILGLFPVANTLFGLLPIYGNDVWLHGLTALFAAYFGFIATPNLLDLFGQERELAKQNKKASQSS